MILDNVIARPSQLHALTETKDSPLVETPDRDRGHGHGRWAVARIWPGWSIILSLAGFAALGAVVALVER